MTGKGRLIIPEMKYKKRSKRGAALVIAAAFSFCGGGDVLCVRKEDRGRDDLKACRL